MGTLLTTATWRKAGSAAYVAIMLAGALLMIYPFLFMLSASFKEASQVFYHPLRLIPDHIIFSNYETIFHHPLFFRWYGNSIVAVASMIALKLLVVTAAAYAFARLRFRGREPIFFVLLAGMMITPDTTIIPRYLLYKLVGLYDTQWAVVLPSVIDVYFVFLLRQFFKSIPMELTEAGMIDGCSHASIYTRIMLPLAVPALTTMVLFTFLWGWNDYISPFIFISDVNKQLLTVGLQYFQGEQGANYALQLTGATIATLPVIVLFSFVQRYFVEGIANTGIKG